MRTKKIYGPDGSTLDETIIEALKTDEGFRMEYFKWLLVERDVPLLASCLKPVVESLGGVTQLAKATGLGRQSLYKTLSGDRHPDMPTLLKILDFAGYELALKKKTPRAVSVSEARESAKAYSTGSRQGKFIKLMKPSPRLAAEIDKKAGDILSGKKKGHRYKGSIKKFLAT